MYCKTAGKGENSSIKFVGALDSGYFSIYLSNENIILIGLRVRIREPAFAALMESKAFDKPKTDGKRLYWTTNGPSLHLDEIIAMVVMG
jgi:hypothetical protein